jgi:hypothetical protein
MTFGRKVVWFEYADELGRLQPVVLRDKFIIIINRGCLVISDADLSRNRRCKLAGG